jgi:hypothetical protein
MGITLRGVPSTAHRSIDQIDSSPECGVYIQIRSVEQVRVLGPSQGCRRPARVAFIAAPDIGKHFGLGYKGSSLPKLDKAAARPLLGSGRDKQLHVGIRANHGTNVTPVEHGSGRASREGALVGKESFAHGLVTRDERGRLAKPG